MKQSGENKNGVSDRPSNISRNKRLRGRVTVLSAENMPGRKDILGGSTSAPPGMGKRRLRSVCAITVIKVINKLI